MELRQLVSFYHVAQLRSVSKAAYTLELGQPTVTTHLRKLEDEFAITLFDRIKRPIQLTSEGSILLELVTPVVEAVGAFDETLGPGAGTPWGSGEDTDYHLRILKAGFDLYSNRDPMWL